MNISNLIRWELIHNQIETFCFLIIFNENKLVIFGDFHQQNIFFFFLSSIYVTFPFL